ncbi:MAG TPA: FkbM family methyltransferase [Nitrospirota bacterium]|nr:FkbM family methyltransferase [Nitrospirota bacterium]
MRLNRMLRMPRVLLRKCGYDFVRYVEASSLANARRLSAIQDNQIDIVLDIGASEGCFGQKLRNSGYKGRIISFEPLTDAYETLLRVSGNDQLWQTVNTAIGNYNGDALINVSGRRTSSSILQMLPSHVEAAPESRYITKEQVQIRCLDSILDDLSTRNNRIYIKIDVQGYERSVLQGAAEMLKITSVVEVEVSMIPLYEGSILHAEMIKELDNLGFYLISWEDVFTDPQTGYVLQSDCIFARDLK